MNQFFKFLFASCLGTALALILLTFIGFSMLAGVASSATQKEKVSIPANSVLELRFDRPIPEKTNNVEMDPFSFEEETVLGLSDMVLAIRQAKEDDDIKGIYLNGTYVAAGKASSSVLREALEDFKSEGKFIISYAPFYTQNAYYLASVADSVLLNPLGAVDFRGFSATIAFYKDMLDRLDVKMRIFYAGKFKSATEPFRLDKMSDENRLQVREYLEAMYEIFLEDIAESRGMSKEELRAIANDFQGRSAADALEAGLIDRIAYEDEAHAALKSNIGLEEKDKVKLISVEDFFTSRVKKLNLKEKNKIAVLFAEGTIKDGPSTEPGSVFSDEYVKMLRKIRKDDKVKALVLRINSPGGSVMASENILREIRLFKESERPVIVSMGDVAASGGYYIACEADSIFAEPNTITGSIGVFGMIPILQNTMKEHLGITYDTVRTGKYSAFGTPFIDFSPEESAMIQNRVEWIYEDFLNKVAVGRNMSRDEVHEIAQGRVWPGNKAMEIGLVDAMGGIDRALSAAADMAGLEAYRVAEYPRTQTAMEQLLERFTNSKKREDEVRAYLLKSELGEMYPAYKTMQDLRESRGIQARLPYELIIN
ncbi:MAG: signal peptide peptidase SppA [Saprospiraceae bacterium]|jgi:protease-4